MHTKRQKRIAWNVPAGTNMKRNNSNKISFYRHMKPIILVCRLFCQFPVQNSTGNSGKNLKFKWFSFDFLWAVFGFPFCGALIVNMGHLEPQKYIPFTICTFIISFAFVIKVGVLVKLIRSIEIFDNVFEKLDNEVKVINKKNCKWHLYSSLFSFYAIKIFITYILCTFFKSISSVYMLSLIHI